MKLTTNHIHSPIPAFTFALSAAWVGVISITLSIAIMVYHASTLSVQATSLQQDAQQVSAKLDSLKLEAMPAQKEFLKMRDAIELINHINPKRLLSVAGVFNTLEATLPRAVLLAGFHYDQAAAEVTLKGAMPPHVSMSQVIDALKKSAHFDRVLLQREFADDQRASITRFELQIKLRHQGAV